MRFEGQVCFSITEIMKMFVCKMFSFVFEVKYDATMINVNKVSV